MRLSDKDLDRLSREAADQYDVEQNPSGWDKLEQKLNKHLPSKGKKERRRFLFFIWMLALLTGGGFVLMLTGNHTRRDLSLKEGSSQMDQVPSENDEIAGSFKKGESKKLSGNRQPEESDEKPVVNVAGEKKNTTRPQSTLTQNDPGKDIPNSAKETDRPVIAQGPGKGSTKTDNPVSQQSTKKPVNDRVTKERSALTASVPLFDSKKNPVVNDNGQVAVNRPNEAAGSKENAAATSPQDQKAIDSSNQSLTETLKPADSSVKEKKAPVNKGKAGFNKGLLVGAVGAPDMSNVGFTNTDNVGYSVGIQLDYRFSPRWSVSTGVIYTKKNYTSQGEDFNPPKGSWIDNIQLDLVEGSCTMFDIPLNLRYDLTQGNKHRYFVNTGLSTYLMKEEEYHYHYQYTNGNPGYRYRTYASDEHHWLSILNLSAGFEKKVNKRLSVQGEPYIKIPLSGVGYGNLKLNSYGIYFSIRYNTGLLSGKK